MEKQNHIDIYIAIFSGILLFTILSITVVYFSVLYKKRLFKKHEEMLGMESQHREDLLFSSIASAENERKRIAADIHDELGSILVTLSYSINKIETEVFQPLALLDDSKGLIEKGLNSVRRISHMIMPPELELYGLLFTIENFCKRLNETLTGIEIDFETSLERFDQPPTTALALYRILQELTTNTIKHADASVIDVKLGAGEKEYILHYADNGVGLDWMAVQTRMGLGFKNIESRVRMIKGSVSYKTAPGRGFSCDITFPR